MPKINEENIDHSNSNYNVDGEILSGDALKQRIHRLESIGEGNRTPEEEQTLERLKLKNEKEIDKIDRAKRDRKNTGSAGAKEGGNNFKKTHKKDGIPNNPAEPAKPVDLSTKGKHSTNKVQNFESYNKEIEGMKYLIEYMNNNDKPKMI